MQFWSPVGSIDATLPPEAALYVWSHLAVTGKSGQLSVYVNGRLRRSVSTGAFGSLGTSGFTAKIGAGVANPSGDHYFAGRRQTLRERHLYREDHSGYPSDSAAGDVPAGSRWRGRPVLPEGDHRRRGDAECACAGINRHVVGDERALQERSSDSILTSSLAWYAVRCTAKRRQRHRWAGRLSPDN
ncbi:MAG: LamG domain-containing protein [Myxococcales bacterium]|nr:LamG domain-containing protein [Myxococcales bacterium]